jgi:hypothetical protein
MYAGKAYTVFLLQDKRGLLVWSLGVDVYWIVTMNVLIPPPRHNYHNQNTQSKMH